MHKCMISICRTGTLISHTLSVSMHTIETRTMTLHMLRQRESAGAHTMTVILCFNLILFDVACRILVIFIVKIEFRSIWITITRYCLDVVRKYCVWNTIYGTQIRNCMCNEIYGVIERSTEAGWKNEEMGESGASRIEQLKRHITSNLSKVIEKLIGFHTFNKLYLLCYIKRIFEHCQPMRIHVLYRCSRLDLEKCAIHSIDFDWFWTCSLHLFLRFALYFFCHFLLLLLLLVCVCEGVLVGAWQK